MLYNLLRKHDCEEKKITKLLIQLTRRSAVLT